MTGAATITLRTPLSEVRLEALSRTEPTAALEHDLDAQIAPRHAAGLGAAAVADGRLVDHEFVAVAAHVVRPAPVDRVERQQVRRGAGVPSGLVDVGETKLRPPPGRSQREPSHAAETVDADRSAGSRLSLSSSAHHRAENSGYIDRCQLNRRLSL